ncbi:MAG TPA: caspase family protein, partial [Stellaceae bacterium]
MSTVVLALASFSAAAQDRGLPTADTGNEQRLALVIGNGGYPEAPLRNPVNDATAMGRTLKKLNFQVVELHDASRKQIAQAILDFGEKLKRGGVGLFYYAGHGVQVRGQNYLVPVDASITSEGSIGFEAIAVESVTDQMGDAGNRINLIILDACRNNPFERRLRGGPRGLAAMDAARGTLIAYATAPGSTAADGDGQNGLYTEELLRSLREPGLKVEEVFKRVRTGVVQKTNGQQTPWESSSLTGDFVFNQTIIIQPPPAQAASPPPAATVAALPPGGGDREVVFWESVRNSSDAADYDEYLRRYPTGTFADLARLRIERLSKQTDKREPSQPAAAAAPAVVAPAPAAAAVVADAPEEFSGAFLTKKRVNVRSGPASGAKVVQTLEPGARVSATGRLPAKGWTRIALKDGSQEGWVTSNLLETEQEAAARKAEEEEAAQRREAKRADEGRATAEAERNFREAQHQIHAQRELAVQQKRDVQERKKRSSDAAPKQRSLAPQASAPAAAPPPAAAEPAQHPGAFRRFFNDVKDSFSGSKAA